MIKSALYLLFFFVISSHSQSRKLYKKTYTKHDGLEIDLVNTMCFDDEGFLWLGGTNFDVRAIISNNKRQFLQRFNGQSFDNIYLPELEETYIKVGQIYRRNDGKFYVKAVTTIGHILYLFDPYSSEFKRIKTGKNISDQVQLSHIFKYNLKDYVLTQIDQKITLSVINNDLSLQSLFSHTVLGNKFLLGSSTQFIPFNNYCIIGDENLGVLIFDWNGNRLNTAEKKAHHPTKFKSKFGLGETLKANNNYYSFIGDQRQIYQIDEKLKSILPATIKNTTPSKNFIDAYNDPFGNNIVISLVENEMRFDVLESEGFKTIHQEKVELYDFGYEIVSKNLKEGLWLTYNNELSYYKFPSEKIKTTLDNHSIRSIHEMDATNYLVASEFKGWYVLNTLKNKVKPLELKLNNTLFKPISSRNIIKDNDSIIWSNSEAYIFKTNIHTLKTEAYNHYPIVCMERATDSIIIYGTQNYNLMEFNTNTKTHKPLVATDSLYIYDIEIQKKSDLVIAGTDKGLLSYNLKTKAHKFYNNKTQLEDPYILSCDYHEDYGYLLGTRTGKIVGFHPENETFTTLYKDDLNAGIATILFETNFWWINTFNGIVAFNPKTKKTTRFSENEGLSNNEANRYSALKTNDNTFLVGTIKGLNYFKPEDLNLKEDDGELVLLKVNQYKESSKNYVTDFNRINFKSDQPIILPTENRALELQFALKNANALTKNYSYRYRLNEKEWIDLKHQNFIQFPNLAAGNYNLEIEALDFSRKKIASSLNLNIESKEFIYKTWWFITLIGLIIISALLWMLQQTQVKKRLQENFSQGLIQSQEEERNRIAIELHDSISQQLIMIKKKAQNTKQDEITILTNNTLEEVRTLSQGLYPPLIKQLGLTESIKQLILDIDEQTSLFVSSEVNQIDGYFNENQALNCYRFIQECTTNVIKHAKAKAVTINVIKTNNDIFISIEDNGKGFDIAKAQIKNSLGLKTIYERVRILKGTLAVDCKLEQGTTFIAQIPIKNA